VADPVAGELEPQHVEKRCLSDRQQRLWNISGDSAKPCAATVAQNGRLPDHSAALLKSYRRTSARERPLLDEVI